MAAKLSYSEMSEVIDAVTATSHGDSKKAYYLIGSLQVLMAELAADLSKAKQLKLLRDLEFVANRVKNYN